MYKAKIESRNLNDQKLTRFYLNASFQGLKRVVFLAFNNTIVDVASNTKTILLIEL